MNDTLPPELRSLPQLFSSQQIEFKLLSGEVTDDKHWSESHVSGTGGGGTNGNTAPTSISTTVTTWREIWLKATNGYETSFVFNAAHIKARKGNQLDLLCIDEGHSLTPVFIYNQAMGVTMATETANRLLTQRGWGRLITGVHVFFFICYLIAMFNSPAGNTVLTFIVLVLLGGLYVPAYKREKAFKQAAYSYLPTLPKRVSAEAA